MTTESTVSSALSSFDAALQAGRLAQAYLVVGNIRDEGVPFAEQALMRLFCQGMMKPCGECPACGQIREHKHVDVVWVEPEKKSRVVGIDRIRELMQVIYQTSYSGGWKAVVLVGADRAGEEASNAFLKTLEEPPPRCIFLLLSDSPQGIMPTILSRCQRIVLSSEPERLPEPWQSELIGILSTPMDSSLTGRLFRGKQLDSLLSDIKKTVEKEETVRFREEQETMRNPDDRKSPKGDEDVLSARIEARFRGLRSMLLRALLFWYRDLLVLGYGADATLLRYPAQAGIIADLARRTSYAEALANVRIIEDMQRQYDRNLSTDHIIAAAVNGLSG